MGYCTKPERTVLLPECMLLHLYVCMCDVPVVLSTSSFKLSGPFSAFLIALLTRNTERERERNWKGLVSCLRGVRNWLLSGTLVSFPFSVSGCSFIFSLAFFCRNSIQFSFPFLLPLKFQFSLYFFFLFFSFIIVYFLSIV